MTPVLTAALALAASLTLAWSPAVADDTASALAGRWTLASIDGDLSDQMARAVDGRPAFEPGTTIDIDRRSGALTARRTTGGAAFRILEVRDDDIRQEIPGGATLTSRARDDGSGVVLEGRLAVRQGLLTRTVPFEEHWITDARAGRLEIVLTLQTPMGVKHRTLTFRRPLFLDNK